jgi:long-subunit fatty acid transport protein
LNKANTSKMEVKSLMEITISNLKGCFVPTHGKMRFAIFLWAFLSVFLVFSQVAQAQYYYPIGARAAGMGDAFIALADDASATYHNPAGLAFVPDNQFSMNGNLYGYHQFRVEDGIRYGKQKTDNVYENYWAVPSFFGMIYKIGAANEGQSRHTLGFSIVIPDHYYFRAIRDIDNGKIRWAISQKYQTYWFGPSYALKILPSLGFGATLYGRYNEDQLSFSREGMLDGKNLSGLNEKVSFIEKEEKKDDSTSILLSIGAKYLIRSIHIGLNVQTPSQHITGKGKSSMTSMFSDDQEGFDKYIKYEPVIQTPLTVGLGLAWQVPNSHTISLDVEYLAAQEYSSLKNITGDTDFYSTQKIQEKQTINFDVGIEYWFQENMSVLGGLYTMYNTIENGEEVGGAVFDIYGASLATGIQKGDYDINVGLGYQFGNGTEQVEYMTTAGNFLYHECDIQYRAIFLTLGTTFHYGGAEDETGLSDKLKKSFKP